MPGWCRGSGGATGWPGTFLGAALYGVEGPDRVNNSDPFGLCPPVDTNNGPECKIVFAGISMTVILGAGFTVAAGVYDSRDGSGYYFRVGGGAGLEAGVGFEAGQSDNRAAMEGDSEGASAGGLLLSGGRSDNASGKTIVGGVAPLGLKAGASTQKTTTVLSKPTPEKKVKSACDDPDRRTHQCDH